MFYLPQNAKQKRALAVIKAVCGDLSKYSNVCISDKKFHMVIPEVQACWGAFLVDTSRFNTGLGLL